MTPTFPIGRLVACLCLGLTGCLTTTYTGHSFDQAFNRTTADAHIEAASQELKAGQDEVALDRLTRLHQAPSIDPAARKLAGQMLNDTCVELIEVLVADNQASRLKRLFGLELPPRLRVEAGIAAARTYLLDGERVQAFKMVRTVERTFPLHHLRMPAGDLLLEAGLSLASENPGWYLFFSPTKDRALEALDFLVLNYPFHPGCDQAYAALAQLYTDADWQARAISHHENLVAFHPNSPLAPEAEARIPMLRLQQMDRPDNDRTEVMRAREEATAWLGRFASHPLADEVRALLVESERTLVMNDLSTARFYLRVKQPFGANLHAKRAREEAINAGDEPLTREAEALLAKAATL